MVFSRELREFMNVLEKHARSRNGFEEVFLFAL